MEVEPRIVKQYKYATTIAIAKITGERGWRVEKKCLCIVFFFVFFLADQKISISWKNAFWGIL